jgi:ABC-type bacteriocin/lantibiotic exporter with double-glycine peptidase domain
VTVSRRTTVAVALVAAAALAACAPRYVGDARRIEPAQVTRGQGWTVASAPAVQQQDANDCGAAALAMVVARWRPALDLTAIRARVPQHPDGHRLGDLRDLARAVGLRAFAIQGDREVLHHELGLGRPVMIGLYRPYTDKRARSHYEVVVGIHPDGRIATIDPADARWHVRTWKGLLAEWEPGGRAALVVLGARDRDVRLSAP